MVRLELLGGFRVRFGETLVPDEMWARRRTAALIKLLCLAPRHRMRRDRLAGALWPGLTPRAAADNLRRTVHLVRRMYAGRYDVVPVESVGDMIGLPADRIWVDVRAFRSAVARARRSRDPHAYAHAVDLYRGPLLPDDNDDWLGPHRADLHRDYVAALEEYASLLEAAGHLDEAVRVTRLHPHASSTRLRRMLALAGRREEEPLWDQVGDERMTAGDTAGALSAYRAGLDLPAPAPEVARRHRLAAAACLGEHDPDQAERHLGLAEQLTTDPAEQARIIGLRAEQAGQRGDVDTALSLADVARAHARMYGTAHDVARAEEAMVLVTQMHGGWWAGLEAELDRSGPALDGDVHVRAFEQHHCAALRRLQSGDLGEQARQLVARADDAGSRRAQAFAWCLLGESLLLRGHFDEAADCLERSTTLDSGAVPWLRLAELAACRRRFDEVGPALRRASAIAAASPAPRHAWARIHATAAFARVELGEPEMATRSVRAAAAAAARIGDCPSCGAMLHPVAAEAYASLGDFEEAGAHAAAAAAVAARFEGPAWRAMELSAAGSASFAGGSASFAAGSASLARGNASSPAGSTPSAAGSASLARGSASSTASGNASSTAGSTPSAADSASLARGSASSTASGTASSTAGSTPSAAGSASSTAAGNASFTADSANASSAAARAHFEAAAQWYEAVGQVYWAGRSRRSALASVAS